MNYKEGFKNFANVTVGIIGDIMLDTYLIGSVDRISPEAPVPIVNINREEKRLGGSGNVALNIKSLGAKPILCAVVGEDLNGEHISQIFIDNSMSTEFLISTSERATTTKTRVLGNNHHLLRIDYEKTSPILDTVAQNLLLKAEKLIANSDILILQDYDKGLFTEDIIVKVIAMANKVNVPVVVDPKRKNFFAYKGVTLFKPNRKELAEGVDMDIDLSVEGSLDKAIALLRENMPHDWTMITLSEQGVHLTDGKNTYKENAHLRTISDVSGAGDTVIGVTAVCMAAGFEVSESMKISNIAGGLVCEESGVVPINLQKLIKETEAYLG